MRVFEAHNLLSKFNISPLALCKFLVAIEATYPKYPDTSYHTNTHGADVTHSTHVLLQTPRLAGVFTNLEVLATILAAIVHDAGHLGVSNNFLVACEHEHAITYNDASVLENLHVATMYRILQRPGCNILSGLSKIDRLAVRHMIITMVLSTDMSFHMDKMADFRTLVNAKTPIEALQGKDRMLVLGMMVHLADLGGSEQLKKSGLGKVGALPLFLVSASFRFFG